MALLNVGYSIADQPIITTPPSGRAPVVASQIKGTIINIVPVDGGPYRVEVQINNYVSNLGQGAMQKAGSRQQVLVFQTDSLAIYIGAQITFDVAALGDYVVPTNISFP